MYLCIFSMLYTCPPSHCFTVSLLYKPSLVHRGVFSSSSSNRSINGLPIKRDTADDAHLFSARSLQQDFQLLSRTTTICRSGIVPQLIFLGAPGVGKGERFEFSDARYRNQEPLPPFCLRSGGSLTSLLEI